MQKKTKIIAIANQKGGVGKTTTAVNLATSMAACGKDVLLIDLDPQGNASTGLGLDHDKRGDGAYALILGDGTASELVKETLVPRLFVLPSTQDLAAAEIELISQDAREFKLSKALEEINERYDYIFIDCPPSLGLVTLNAFCAAHRVLVPLQCEFYALEGLSQLHKTITRVQEHLNTSLELEGIVLTMHDKRNNLTLQVEENVRDYFGSKVYETIIPRNIKISEAPSHGLPAIIYDMKCAGSSAYLSLAKEVLKRERESQKGKQAA